MRDLLASSAVNFLKRLEMYEQWTQYRAETRLGHAIDTTTRTTAPICAQCCFSTEYLDWRGPRPQDASRVNTAKHKRWLSSNAAHLRSKLTQAPRILQKDGMRRYQPHTTVPRELKAPLNFHYRALSERGFNARFRLVVCALGKI